jgi:antitoxin YefM
MVKLRGHEPRMEVQRRISRSTRHLSCFAAVASTGFRSYERRPQRRSQQRCHPAGVRSIWNPFRWCRPLLRTQPPAKVLASLRLARLDQADAFTHALDMTSLPITQARSRLYQLLDEAAASHEPIQITGKRSNAVLVTEDDWRSIQETLYLVSIPGMRDSIRKGMTVPLGKTSTKPGW